jgi:hypothetical protein
VTRSLKAHTKHIYRYRGDQEALNRQPVLAPLLRGIPLEFDWMDDARRHYIVRKILFKSGSPSSPLSKAEFQRFAEQFADCILDPRQQWLIGFVMTDGFAYIPTEEEITSGKFALRVLKSFEQEPGLIEVSVYDALTKPDRGALAAWILKRSIACKLSRDQMSRLLACGNSTILRESFKALRKQFNAEPGAKPKLPLGQYPVLLETVEMLQPAILKFLAIPKTRRTLGETLRYLKKDYPQACEFLSRHIEQFQRALDDAILLSRAKTTVEGRAKVLAEAMAGSNYQLTFSTSRERVRRARQLVQTTHP